MNIQGMLQQLGNIITSNNASSSGSAETIRQQAEPAPLPQQQAPVAEPQTNVKMGNQDAVNALLKELTDKLATSQKNIDQMPESLKNEIRQLLSERTSLADLRNGMSQLVQGQKDTVTNLTKLADALNNLAKFLAEAEQAGGKDKAMQQLQQQLTKDMPTTEQGKGALQEKITSQLIKELLDSIVTKPTEQGVKPAPQQTEQGKEAQNAKQPVANEQQNTKDIPKNQANNNAANDGKLPVKDTPAQQMNNTRPAETGQNTRPAEQTQTNGKENLPANDKSANNTRPSEQIQQPVTKEAQAQTRPQQQQGVSQTNSLLNLAKNTMLEGIIKDNTAILDVNKLAQNMQKVTSILKELMMQKPELAKAMQTLESNPNALSANDKAMLHSVIAQIIKESFKTQQEINTLQRALGQFSGKGMDKDTLDMQAMFKLLKNTENLQYSRQQIQDWANSLRDMASGLAKTGSFSGEKTSQHIQNSFVFYLSGEGQEKNQPVYLNIYHEKEERNANGVSKPAETWLKINVTPEYVGEVTAIFHLHQENLLDVKVVFENQDGMAEFSRFVPSIKNALQDTNMELNSILLV